MIKAVADMGIGLDLAIQATERAKQNKAIDEAFGTVEKEQYEYFYSKQDGAQQTLTDDSPLDLTQFMDADIKTVDDYFKK